MEEMEVSVSKKSVYREMVCKICSDLLKEPKMLSCAHSFCKECLTSIHQTSCKSPSTGLQYDMDSDGSDNCYEEDQPSNRIECPDCLQITVLTEECSIESLNTHHKLEKTIATLSSEERQMARDKVGAQQKMVTSITEGIVDYSPGSCVQHEKEEQYFCVDCNIAVCVDCASDTHALHQCSELSTLVLDSLSQLQSLIQPACEYTSRADVSLKKLGQDCESIESNRNVCKEAVCDVFNKVRAAVDQREKALLNRVDSYIDQKLQQVARQKQNLAEVQDQLHDSILEVQQILDSLLTDISLLVDKQRVLDDVEIQVQNILDIESSMTRSMFSSTYVGFRDDDLKAVQKDVDVLITLCEFYPDEDTGYYSSRAIPMEQEENLYTLTGRKEDLIPPSTESEEEVDTIKEFPIFSKEKKRKAVKRSQSTPTANMKEKWMLKKRTSSNVDVPLIPIRFDSLVSPTPIIPPDKIFNKLTASKTETVNPCGVCVGENGSYIISDVKNHCLRIIASNGKFIDVIGKEGKGSGQFEEPSAVVVNEKAQIFVCQRENPRIQKFTSAGKYVQKFGHKSLRGGNSLGEPWGIVRGPDDKLFVTDWDKCCIHIFYSNGRYDCTIGNDSSMLGESLKFPAGITVTASGHLVVADRGNHCVWILQPNGDILTRVGCKGHGPGELFLPYGVAIHPNGSIIVSESGNHRISIFSPDGKFLKHFGRKGSDPGMFHYPRHICVTSKGEIIVADELNGRLQLFMEIL